MSQIKFTKNELRAQQYKLTQLERYLPTLQLKKAMLQVEVYNARLEVDARTEELRVACAEVTRVEPLMQERLAISFDDSARIQRVDKHYENIAGVEIPLLEGILFEEFDYNLFDNPPWVDGTVGVLRGQVQASTCLEIAEEKCKALEHELREVSIRVNLFEKILIPRTLDNITRIKVFLGDQQLAAVAQAKVAKTKIEKRKGGADAS